MENSNTGPGPGNAKNTILVATQKTFVFPAKTKTEIVDAEVNKWLLESALRGAPASLGKTYTGGFFRPKIYITYMYARKVNAPERLLKN